MNEETVKKKDTYGPVRLRELWTWFAAVYEWDWGDARRLAFLIREEKIPPEFQTAIGDIIEGVRTRPNYGKSAVSAYERFNLAMYSMTLSSVRDELVTDRDLVCRMSEETRIEPIELIGRIRKLIRDKMASKTELGLREPLR